MDTATSDFLKTDWYPVIAINGISAATYSPKPQGSEAGWVERWNGPDLAPGGEQPREATFAQGSGLLTIPFVPAFGATGLKDIKIIYFRISITDNDNVSSAPTSYVYEVLNQDGNVIAAYTQSFTVSTTQKQAVFLFRPGIRKFSYETADTTGVTTVDTQSIYLADLPTFANPVILPADDIISPVSARIRVLTNISGRVYSMTPCVADESSWLSAYATCVINKNNLSGSGDDAI